MHSWQTICSLMRGAVANGPRPCVDLSLRRAPAVANILSRFSPSGVRSRTTSWIPGANYWAPSLKLVQQMKSRFARRRLGSTSCEQRACKAWNRQTQGANDAAGAVAKDGTRRPRRTTLGDAFLCLLREE